MTPDDRPPRIVPMYALTGGRTRTTHSDLPWEALIATTAAGVKAQARMRWEPAHIVSMCQGEMLSVAEVAAALDVPVTVARVLVSDLLAEGLVQVHCTLLTAGGRPDTHILERLIAGLRAAV